MTVRNYHSRSAEEICSRLTVAGLKVASYGFSTLAFWKSCSYEIGSFQSKAWAIGLLGGVAVAGITVGAQTVAKIKNHVRRQALPKADRKPMSLYFVCDMIVESVNPFSGNPYPNRPEARKTTVSKSVTATCEA